MINSFVFIFLCVIMPYISCFLYRLWFRLPYNLTFIKFDNFVKVVLNSKSIILSNEDLASNQRLFELFILSLLLTEDISTISSVIHENGRINYCVSTLNYSNGSRQLISDNYVPIPLEKSRTKNPLNSREPKRASSEKKLRKFFKSFEIFYDNEMIKDPLFIYEEFFERELCGIIEYVEKVSRYETKINILSTILHNYGCDVYRSVNRFL